jgi:hypothetical protein
MAIGPPGRVCSGSATERARFPSLMAEFEPARADQREQQRARSALSGRRFFDEAWRSEPTAPVTGLGSSSKVPHRLTHEMRALRDQHLPMLRTGQIASSARHEWASATMRDGLVVTTISSRLPARYRMASQPALYGGVDADGHSCPHRPTTIAIANGHDGLSA